MHFAREAAECGLNLGSRETGVQSERDCGGLQFGPKILPESLG